jgi:hypothetical protein
VLVRAVALGSAARVVVLVDVWAPPQARPADLTPCYLAAVELLVQAAHPARMEPLDPRAPCYLRAWAVEVVAPILTVLAAMEAPAEVPRLVAAVEVAVRLRAAPVLPVVMARAT